MGAEPYALDDIPDASVAVAVAAQSLHSQFGWLYLAVMSFFYHLVDQREVVVVVKMMTMDHIDTNPYPTRPQQVYDNAMDNNR